MICAVKELAYRLSFQEVNRKKEGAMAFPKRAGALDMVSYQGHSNLPLRNEHGRNHLTVRSVIRDVYKFERQLRSDSALLNISIIFQQ